MKSLPWPMSLQSLSRILPAACGALVVLVSACAKDADSREPKTATQEAAQAAETPTAVAIETPADKAAAKLGATRALNNSAGALGDHSYSITLDVPDSVAAGAEAVARVIVTPKSGWKMNHEFPTRLQVTAPPGVSLAKDKLSVADAETFEDKGATFAVKFTPDSAGEKSFQANFKFAVCTDATCDPKKQKLAWVVDVQ